MAKLSHVLVPSSQHEVCVAAGWTRENPFFQPVDHGICWAAFDLSAYVFPERNREGQRSNREKGGPTQKKKAHRKTLVRTAGADRTTHEKYPGVPMRLLCPGDPEAQRGLHTASVVHILESAGYDVSRVLSHERMHKLYADDLAEIEMLERGRRGPRGRELTSLRQAIRYNSWAGEQWVTFKDDHQAAHALSRGKGLPALKGNAMQSEGTVGCTWKVRMSSGEPIPTNSLRPWTMQQIHVPGEDIQEVHTFRNDPGYGEITFKTAKACSHWSRFGTPLPPTQLGKREGRRHDTRYQMVFAYATGWEAYAERIRFYFDHPRFVRNRRVRSILEKDGREVLDSG